MRFVVNLYGIESIKSIAYDCVDLKKLISVSIMRIDVRELTTMIYHRTDDINIQSTWPFVRVESKRRNHDECERES